MSSSSSAAFVRNVVRTPSSHLGVPLSFNCPNIRIIYLERTFKHIGGIKLWLLCASKASRLPSVTNNLSITSISRCLVSTSKLQYVPEYWQVYLIHRILQEYESYDSILCTGTGKSLIFEGLAVLGEKASYSY